MASPTCWRCLSRASNNVYPIIQSARTTHHVLQNTASSAGFSTTSWRFRVPLAPKKPGAGRSTGPPSRGVKATFSKKKKGRPDRAGKPPPQGERKALRKRIVLSNTNALEVEGMQDFSIESMLDEGSQGKVFGIPGPVVDQLRAANAFKTTQGWGLFRRPGMLVRKETLWYGKMIEEMSREDDKKVVRRVLLGERGSGKSLMLLQAMTMAFLKRWTVINIPEGTSTPISLLAIIIYSLSTAQDLTIGHTAYTPLPRTTPTVYAQPTYTASLLSSIARSNPHLSSLQLSQTPPASPSAPLPPLPPSLTLSALCALASNDPEASPSLLSLLLSDLASPGRPPILFCLDGLAHAMASETAYTTPELKPIHAQDLSLLQTFSTYLSGASALPNGGMVLAATSQSNAPPLPTLAYALAALESPASPSAQRNPFKNYDERVLDVLDPKKGVEVQRVDGLSREEVRGLMEYWAHSGMIRQRVDGRMVGEKWAVSGGGVVGELERAVLRAGIAGA